MKKLLQILKPAQIKDNIFSIDFFELKNQGITSLIFDIDDTLMPRTEKNISLKVSYLISTLKDKGFKICLTSNSRHPKRVELIAKELDVPYIYLAMKPFPQAFKKSLEILKSTAAETAVIGDQLFMDILGGNLQKMHTIFIKEHTAETFLPRQIMRWVEDFILPRL